MIDQSYIPYQNPTKYISKFPAVLIGIVASHIPELLVMDTPSEKEPSSMSTPQCTAEERAWLLVYSKRIYRKQLSIAFHDQFPSGRTDRNVLRHAYYVSSCDAAVKSQLLDLAKTMPWYVSLESKDPLLSLVMSLEQV